LLVPASFGVRSLPPSVVFFFVSRRNFPVGAVCVFLSPPLVPASTFVGRAVVVFFTRPVLPPCPFRRFLLNWLKFIPSPHSTYVPSVSLQSRCRVASHAIPFTPLSVLPFFFMTHFPPLFRALSFFRSFNPNPFFFRFSFSCHPRRYGLEKILLASLSPFNSPFAQDTGSSFIRVSTQPPRSRNSLLTSVCFYSNQRWEDPLYSRFFRPFSGTLYLLFRGRSPLVISLPCFRFSPFSFSTADAGLDPCKHSRSQYPSQQRPPQQLSWSFENLPLVPS